MKFLSKIRTTKATFVGAAFLSAALALLLLFHLPVHAADDNGAATQITISPVSTELAMNPGANYNGSFMVINNGKTDFDFDVYASPYIVTGENYEQKFEGDTTHTQIAKWVKFDQSEYHLKVGDSIKVPYTVNVPASVPDGGQYAVLFAQTKAKGATGGGSSVISEKRVGMVIYGRVNGTTKYSGQVVSASADWWQTDKSLTSNVKIKNDGNADFKAKVDTSISGFFGGGEQYSDSVELHVLPDTTRAFTMEWNDAPMIGLFRVKQNVTFLDQTKSYSHIVLMMPVWVLIVFIAIILLIIIGIWYATHSRKKSKR